MQTITLKERQRKKEAKRPPLLRASCRIRTNDPEITNHVLWPTELKRRVGKLLTSRRYNQLPLLRSRPGGFEGSWPCKTYPCLSFAGAKVHKFFLISKQIPIKLCFFFFFLKNLTRYRIFFVPLYSEII